MEGVYRSRSCSHGHGQMEVYGGGRGDFRSYSTSSSSSYAYNNINQICISSEYSWQQAKEEEKKKKKKKSSGWIWNDPEVQRKKRVASYKVYSAEGKVKGSFRKSFRWLKDRYTQVLHGWS